jgi:hypothetical protein
MTLARGFLACALFILSAGVVRADGISPNDPKIIVGRETGSMSITASPFTVPVNSSGGGIFNFDNATVHDWIGMILTVTFPNGAEAMAAAVSCSNDVLTDIYSSCSSERHGRTVTITLTGGVITPCSEGTCSLDSKFFVDLNDDATLHDHGKANGMGGWKGDIIEGRAITTPEPATLPLLISGLGGIWLWRKRHIVAESKS